MQLWFLMTILCSTVAVFVSVPLIRRLDATPTDPAQDVAIYQDQLKEIDRDLQSGSINAPEADSAKAEIQRRLNATTKNLEDARPISNTWRNAALVATAGMVIVGSVNLYNFLGSPDLPSVAANPPPPAANAGVTPSQVEAMIAKLQARVQANPKDAEAWRFLGWSQFNMQHYSESTEAYAKAVELDPKNIEYRSAYAEAITQGAQGIVTPKARAVFAEVLAAAPKDARARFYDALAHQQSGDQNAALERWMALYADAPADAAWREDVKQRITDLEKATGANSTIPRSASAPAITDAQKAQVQAMAPADQQEMIKGMVEKLAAKMAANPKDFDGWIRLMRAFKVLNQPDKAEDALGQALAAFATDQAGTEKLKAAAAELGIN
jgi:cytochrome c-type biogenesis protein CcmH